MPAPRMALQLYSVRHLLETAQERTLAQVRALGLHTVEVYDFVGRSDALSAALRGAGLTARTGHAGFLSPDTSSASARAARLEETFQAARALGLESVFDPFVAPDRWVDEKDVAATAGLLNQAAEAAAAHGLTVGYHNHSQEFVHAIKGISAFEFFAGLLDPRVKLEIDLYWAAVGGNDPVSLLERLGDRVEALHIKDGAVIDDPFFSGAPFDPADTGQVAPGQGQIPLDAALSTARHARWAVIEFDHYDGDVLDGIAAGVRYLHAKGIGR
ncbi:sugar phosphate isomerase/epimerase family protein [Streptomyces tendae]|uniref:sugar phosphate isomerase/epimerase family protein n=1 Tax=Streptomyces tendae TaxID=1932 RepID=UPI0037A5E28F